MTISDINNFVNMRGSTDTTQFSAANRLISTNRWMHKVWTMILRAQDTWDVDDLNQTDTPTATTPLVAGQRSYAFTSSLKILSIDRVDICYDGVNYVRALPLDTNDYKGGLGSESLTDTNFSKSAPRYDLRNNQIYIYPRAEAADVTAGGLLRIEFSREVLDFTSGEVTTGTKEPGFDEPFHAMIPLGMCYDWFMANGESKRAEEVWMELQDYERKLLDFYSHKDLDNAPRFRAKQFNYE